MMKGYDMETACKMGSVASSLVVGQMGGQRGVPTYDMLLEKYVQWFGHIENI
jgi:sugar/nucleoside kinase (ribokinase family)